MSIDGLKNATRSGLKGILLPFARWIEEVKAVQLPGAPEDIVDEWVELSMDKLTATAGTIASMFQSSPEDEDELPTTDEGK